MFFRSDDLDETFEKVAAAPAVPVPLGACRTVLGRPRRCRARPGGKHAPHRAGLVPRQRDGGPGTFENTSPETINLG